MIMIIIIFIYDKGTYFHAMFCSTLRFSFIWLLFVYFPIFSLFDTATPKFNIAII